MRQESGPSFVVQLVLYLTGIGFAFAICAIGAWATYSLDSLQRDDMPTIAGQTLASIENLVATSLDDEIAATIDAELWRITYAMLPKCGMLQTDHQRTHEGFTLTVAFPVSGEFVPSIPIAVNRPMAR